MDYENFRKFLRLLGSLDIPSLGWSIPILGLLIYVSVQVLIVFIYYLIHRHGLKLLKMPPDLYNGLRFFIRIATTTISVLIFIIFLDVKPESVLLVIGIFTTAILFASIKTINNFIAGVWIAFTRPFSVGDYVKIQNIEGIVAEISMNYTKIKHKTNNITQIPNLECLKSKITNYTIDMDYYQNEIERLKGLISSYKEKIGESYGRIQRDLAAEIEEIEQVRKEYLYVQEWLIRQKNEKNQVASRYLRSNKLVRYTFTLSLDRFPETNARKLDVLCKKYREKFRITPDWKVVGLHYNIEYMFVIITPDPEDIIEFYDDFLWDMYCLINSKD